MKNQGRRGLNAELQARYTWVEERPASQRSQRRLLLKLARKNGTDTSNWPNVPDHKEVIAAMKIMKLPEEQ